MTYAVRYESDIVSKALADAQARFVTAQNKLRLKKGLELLQTESGDPFPADDIPLQPLREWGFSHFKAAIWVELTRRAPIGLDAIGCAAYGDNWGPHKEEALTVHLSQMRRVTAKTHIVIPLVGRDRRICRPYRVTPA